MKSLISSRVAALAISLLTSVSMALPTAAAPDAAPSTAPASAGEPADSTVVSIQVDNLETSLMEKTLVVAPSVKMVSALNKSEI